MRNRKLQLAIAAAIAFLIGFLSTLRPAPAQARFEVVAQTQMSR